MSCDKSGDSIVTEQGLCNLYTPHATGVRLQEHQGIPESVKTQEGSGIGPGASRSPSSTGAGEDQYRSAAGRLGE